MRHYAAIVLTILICSCGAWAQSAPAVGPAERPPDLCKGAIDPYDAPAEKVRFFAAAGVDNELTEKEFAANRSDPKAFVRPFDTWAAILSFNKDRNETIDWLEAHAYRQAFRKRVLAMFDADKDKRLGAAERDKANRALVARKVSLPTQAKASPRTGVLDRRQREMLARYDTDGDGKINAAEQTAMRAARQEQRDLRRYNADKDGKLDQAETARRDQAQAEREKQRQERLEKYDADGDGQLSRTERRASWRAERAQRLAQQLKTHDKDGDGKLDDAERTAMRAAQRRRWELRRYDADGDGKLSEAETAKRDDERKRWAARRQEFVERFDTDGDGELSQDERAEMVQSFQARRRAMRERMDADGDGRVSREEREAFGKKMLEQYDVNGDGRLDSEERAKMRQEQSEAQPKSDDKSS